MRPDELGELVAIVEGLPDYFTNDVSGKLVHDVARHEAWVVTQAGAIAGFAVVARRSPLAAEILWMAVAAARRGTGLGRALVDRVLDSLGQAGTSVVEVKTQDASAGYAPYEATRAFWERNGFVHVDSIDPFPEWGPGNPAAIYVAALRPTRQG